MSRIVYGMCVVYMWVVKSLWVCERKLAMERSTTLSQVVKDKFKSIKTVDYTSSEESEEENAHSLVVHPLARRSREVRETFSFLDRKSARKRTSRSSRMRLQRKIGEPRTRPPPDYAPEWSIYVMEIRGTVRR